MNLSKFRLRQAAEFAGLFALICLVSGVTLLPAAPVEAAGFYLPGRGVRPLGRAGAFVASGEGNLNSLWYNPANLTLSDGLKLTIDAGLINLNSDFTRAPRTDENGEQITYGKVSNESAPQASPQLLIGGPTGVDGLSWAAGFYAPYMSPVTYPESGSQRYTIISNSGSIMAFFHAALAYEVGDSFRIGAGFQNAIASFRLVSITSGYTGLHGRPEDSELDILSKVEMSDYFIPTGNLGVWVKLGEYVEAAMSVQGPVTVDDANAKLTVRMPSSPEFDNAELSNNTIGAKMQIPPVFRVGFRFVNDPIDIELTGVWEGWSSFDEIRATPKNTEVTGLPGIGSIPVGPLSIPQNAHDTYSLRLGGDYRVSTDLSLRAGLGYETSSIPDEYYSVFLPDADKYTLAAGLTWGFSDLEIDFGAAYYLYSDRTITNSKVRQINPTDTDQKLATIVGNGEYSASYLVLGLGVNYAFGE